MTTRETPRLTRSLRAHTNLCRRRNLDDSELSDPFQQEPQLNGNPPE